MSAAQPTPSPSGGLLQREVIEQLGKQIVTGRWPGGTVLRMDELADQLDVSRSVIREAGGWTIQPNGTNSSVHWSSCARQSSHKPRGSLRSGSTPTARPR